MNTETSNHQTADGEVVDSPEFQSYLSLSKDYHSDPDLRDLADSDPVSLLAKYQIPLPPHMDVRIVANTEETINFVMPEDPNKDLADEDLMAVAGGKSMSSAGTAGTLSTIASSASTASSVGSAGSANPGDK